MADLFGALMIRLNFSHDEIMALPFKTFLIYQELINKITQPAEDPQIKKWRADAEKWRDKNLGK